MDYCGLANHLRIVNEGVPNRRRPSRTWPYVFVLGFALGAITIMVIG